MPGRQDWQGTPQQSGQANVLNALAVNIGAGGNHAFTIPINRPGYVLKLHLRNSTDNTTVLPLHVDMMWKDTTVNTVLDRQLWYLFAGTNAAQHFVIGSGPTAGDTLVMTIYNETAGAVVLTCDVIMDVVSQQPDIHNWFTDTTTSFTIPGFTAPPIMSPDADVLALRQSASVAAGTTVSYILPLYTRRSRLHMETASGLTDLKSQIFIPVSGLVTVNTNVHSATSDATGAINADLFLPRHQCAISFTNSNAAAQNVLLALVTGND